MDLNHHAIREREYGEKREYKLTKLLPRSLLSIHEEFEEIRREICTESPRGFEIKSNSRFSCRGCEHAATPYDIQHSHMANLAMREEGEEDMPKKGTLRGFLHEYESQTQRFRDHVTFPEFCKIMVRRSNHQDEDTFIQSIFDGSPTCSARAWIEELDTFLQQHQIS